MGEAAEPRVRQCPLRQRGGCPGWRAEVVGEERRHLRHVIDARSRRARGGRSVRPGAGEQSRGRAKALDRAEGRVAIAIGPSGDDHRGNVDAVVALPIGAKSHRAMPPVGIVVRVTHPDELPGLMLIDAAQPLRAPVMTFGMIRGPDLGHGRECAHGCHVGAVVDLIDPLEGTAHVVDVVGVAIIGRVDRDDRPQMRWTLASELEGVESAVRRAKHADVAVAPRLRSQPGNRLGEIALLCLRVFVRRAPTTAARATHVDARDREAEVIAEALILRAPAGSHVVLAIGQRLEDAGSRRGVGDEERDAQMLPVRQRDGRADHRSNPRTSSMGRARSVRP